MSALLTTDDLFFAQTGLDRVAAERIIEDTLEKCDDGELFLEYRQSESFVLDDGQLKSASFDTSHGFGLRAVAGDVTGYAHASALTEDALRRGADAVRAVRAGHDVRFAAPPAGTNRSLYAPDNPLSMLPFER